MQWSATFLHVRLDTLGQVIFDGPINKLHNSQKFPNFWKSKTYLHIVLSPSLDAIRTLGSLRLPSFWTLSIQLSTSFKWHGSLRLFFFLRWASVPLSATKPITRRTQNTANQGPHQLFWNPKKIENSNLGSSWLIINLLLLCYLLLDGIILKNRNLQSQVSS